MPNVSETRRANLILLLKEVGEGRGDAARLSRLTSVKAPIISQLRRVTRYTNGVERAMGDEIARKLEQGMGKENGWMDVPHDSTRSEEESEFLRSFRLLTPEQQEHLAATANILAKANAPPPGAMPIPMKTRKGH